MLANDLKPYIERLVKREITNREVARLLGTHESYVCRVLARLGVKKEEIVRPPSNKELAAARAEHRARLAATLPVAEAARQAHCSERTIYRIKAKG